VHHPQLAFARVSELMIPSESGRKYLAVEFVSTVSTLDSTVYQLR
jgi:hypothetical protein